MNLKHLYYFWKVAKLGGVNPASRAIHITPQTLSGQINRLEARLGVALFQKLGRGMTLTPAGEMALEYAEELFTLSDELEQSIRHFPEGRPSTLRVGVANALPKSLVFQLLRPVLNLDAMAESQAVRVICNEWDDNRLLADLSLHRLDVVLTDSPLSSPQNLKTYHHKLGESGLTWLAPMAWAKKMRDTFPQSLQAWPILLPGEHSSVRQVVDQWLLRHRLKIKVSAELDDLALMSAFGREGVGAFAIPSVLLHEFTADQRLTSIGEMNPVKVSYYAMTVNRRITHPQVQTLIHHANQRLEKSIEIPAASSKLD